jgi:hypothetical protein
MLMTVIGRSFRMRCLMRSVVDFMLIGYTLCICGSSDVPRLNLWEFGRILYVQTNLSAALCAIRVAERGVGL